MLKSDILTIIRRRKHQAHKISSDPQYCRAIRDNAAGAWKELVSLEMEIEEHGTQRERDEYPVFY